jgi:sialate O-acetylesterase
MLFRTLFALLASIAACAQTATADVKLPGVFSDHMVLQADLAAPVFGKAAPEEAVTVEIGDQKKTVTADKDGNWIVKLDPLKAGGPFALKISGKNTITIKDVLVGEVWIASGQSNMRFPLNRTTSGKEEVAAANHPQIRYVIGVGKWGVCSPQTAGNYSGVAYHFAVELQKTKKVPVGIIDNSVSGALGEAFMSPASIEANPEVAAYVKKRGEGSSDIWKASFVPIIPYGIRGALWYQGEGNRDYPVSYAKLLPALIADWRQHWHQGDFPFLIVQLANYQDRKPDPWEGKDCALREAQMKTAKVGKNTALVVTIDLGIAKDVHYPDKKPVGERLALAARGVAYGEKLEYSGPLFESAKFENGKAIVSFTHVGGLVAKGQKDAKLTGFLLCGADKKFVRAEATIEGDKVIVQSDKVPNPIAVRYAWERNPECNLFNKDGLPASPFRSDDFLNFFTKDGG